MGEVKNCPRCGSSEISYGYSFPPLVWGVNCHADGCEAATVADSEAAAFEFWNAGIWQFRPVEWDEFGTPTEYEYNAQPEARATQGGGNG